LKQPTHGCIECTRCKDLFEKHDVEDGAELWGQGEGLRLINNPATWGASTPKVWLLGFSKGQTQNKAIAEYRRGYRSFESIPFDGFRDRLRDLLAALEMPGSASVDEVFKASESRYRTTSVIRCSISARVESGKYSYRMKDILGVADTDKRRLREIMSRCVGGFLSQLVPGDKVILQGLDSAYIKLLRSVVEDTYGGAKATSPVTYRANGVSWIHVSHLSKAQPENQFQAWLAGNLGKGKVRWAKEELRGLSD
jgi:hypothetical protein